ncbi:MAG: DNA-directed RNA polymerase subunit omega [Thermodesulfobacteriota bacterium]|nr:DNA-directed RNA polymerase subunit omega [Thermodesulfobacteriota bacterium]
MARVTIEDSIKNVENRFQLVHLTARRVRQFRHGAVPMSDRNNKDIVLALREIAAKDVTVKNIDSLEPGPREDLDLIQPFKVSENETG